MLTRPLLLFITLSMFSWVCYAQPTQCESALIPSVTRQASDYMMTQSYMSINAAYEYENLRAMSKESRGASASYKLFSAEYEDSSSASKFQEKVSSRLKREGYSMNEAEAKTYYRRYLSDAQLKAWNRCVGDVVGAGAIMLSTKHGAENALPIRVEWIPQKGVGSALLEIGVTNGVIEGSDKFEVKLSGRSSRSVTITPAPSGKSIVITANIAGLSDELIIPPKYPEIKLPPSCPPGKEKFVVQAYTTGGEGRKTKSNSCPKEMIVIPNSAHCLRTADVIGQLLRSEQVGQSTWVCEWDPQPEGVGIWIEMGCKCPKI